MDTSRHTVALVMIAGPQASGKSTLATALTAALRRDGETVALIELDQIAAMALPTLPSWDIAHEIFETVTGMWATSGISCIVAEGSGTQEEISKVLNHAPPGSATITVVTTTPFEIALTRAQADPTRGISRHRDFLLAVYERWASEMTLIDADLLIDTNAVSVTQSIACIRESINSARGDHHLDS